MQKYINSRTNHNDPFDCRVIVQKNRHGKWEIAQILIRTGIGQKVVSNTSKGGGISYPKQFLKHNFKDQWKEVYKDIKNSSLKLAYKFEEIKKTPTMDLGLDIGIEKDGSLYLFEINNGSNIKRLVAESAILRVEYYLYLYETNPSLINVEGQISENITYLQQLNESLANENKIYKKKIQNMKMSTSWKITKPLRWIDKMLK